MNDLRNRLESVFATVFPDLSPGEVAQASTETLGSWESVMTLTNPPDVRPYSAV